MDLWENKWIVHDMAYRYYFTISPHFENYLCYLFPYILNLLKNYEGN